LSWKNAQRTRRGKQRRGKNERYEDEVNRVERLRTRFQQDIGSVNKGDEQRTNEGSKYWGRRAKDIAEWSEMYKY
jgi:hypothetical protein